MKPMQETVCFNSHEAWSFFPDANTFENFKEKILPKIYLKNEVPEDVKKSFEVIQNLLDHSYCEYEFLDVAVVKALTTFEMSLKIRYAQIKNESPGKRKLQGLIDVFRKEGYFESDYIEFFTHVRDVRNLITHPHMHTIGGIFWTRWILNASCLINDLYEDEALRNQRKRKRNKILSVLDPLVDNGAELIFKGKPYWIQVSQLIFIDNKNMPELICFGFVPRFNMEERKSRDIADFDSEFPFVFCTDDYHYNPASRAISLKKISDDQFVYIRPLQDVELISQYKDWEQQLASNLELRFYYSNYIEKLNMEFLPRWQAFHMR